MSCIKTGARIYFYNYDCTAPADIYAIPGTEAIVIRTNGMLEDVASYLPEAKASATFELVTPNGDPGFWRNDLGVFVVHRGFLRSLPGIKEPEPAPAPEEGAQ